MKHNPTNNSNSKPKIEHFEMNLAKIVLRKLPARKINLLCPTTSSKTIFCQRSTKGKSSKSSSSSSSSSDSDSDEIAAKKTTSNEAVIKLNSLLQQMFNNDVSKTETTLNLARPSNKRIKQKTAKDIVKTDPVEKQVVNAVRNVAETLGGDTKQTESELLLKLLNPANADNESTTNLSDIIKGMKIERDIEPEQSKADQVRKILQQVSSRPRIPDQPVQRKPRVPVAFRKDIVPQKIDLFGSEPLGVFTDQSKLRDSTQLRTWQRLYEKELKLAVTHPPANYFQQMILWTEQGKFWKFPINNEYGLDEEAKVYFADHVFLEEHLEPWCPTKGPIRHFMELVCVGLSKNPYLTVEAKKEHIEWYKNYFEDKKKLLQDVGAIPADIDSENPKSIDK